MNNSLNNSLNKFKKHQVIPNNSERDSLIDNSLLELHNVNKAASISLSRPSLAVLASEESLHELQAIYEENLGKNSTKSKNSGRNDSPNSSPLPPLL